MKNRKIKLRHNWGLLALAFILLGAGLLLLFYPAQSMKTLCYLTAVTTALVGIALMLNALSFDKKQWKFLVYLVSGGLVFVSGVLLFFAPDEVFVFYTAVIGLLLILNGGFALQSLVLSKQAKSKAWWIKLPFCLAVILGGFLCVRLQNVSPHGLCILFGLTLAFTGMLNMLSFFTPSMQLQTLYQATQSEASQPVSKQEPSAEETQNDGE